MQTDKAIAFKDYLLKANEVFTKFYNYQPLNESDNIDEIKAEMNDSFFEEHYNFFIEELKDNIIDYQDINIVSHYLRGCFMELEEWTDDENLNIAIITKGIEVPFLFKLNTKINVYANRIQSFMRFDINGFPDGLFDIYNETIKMVKTDNKVSNDDYNPPFDMRFNFDSFQLELAQLSTNQKKIDSIKQRLIDFEQWQIINNIVDVDSFWGSVNPRRSEFVKLCRSEMKRYHVDKIDAGIHIPVEFSGPMSTYKWTASDTDLIELLTALYHSGSIERKDGKPLTRKSLLEFFQQLFNIEIKDVEGKLARATNRKINNTPFLDSLKGAFENYADEKMEKQSKRK